MFEESRAMFEEFGIRRGVADVLWILGIAARLEGDLPRSRTLAEESLRLHRQAGDLFGATAALHTVGRTALAQEDLTTAASSFLEALHNDEQVGNRTGMAIVMDNLAAREATLRRPSSTSPTLGRPLGRRSATRPSRPPGRRAGR
jgi:hypothetical protein